MVVVVNTVIGNLLMHAGIPVDRLAFLGANGIQLPPHFQLVDDLLSAN